MTILKIPKHLSCARLLPCTRSCPLYTKFNPSTQLQHPSKCLGVLPPVFPASNDFLKAMGLSVTWISEWTRIYERKTWLAELISHFKRLCCQTTENSRWNVVKVYVSSSPQFMPTVWKNSPFTETNNRAPLMIWDGTYNVWYFYAFL